MNPLFAQIVKFLSLLYIFCGQNHCINGFFILFLLIYIFFLTVIKRAFLSLQEKSSCVLQTGVIVISLYRFAYRIKILLTDRLSEAISDAIFSFYIIIRCVRAGWPQGSPLQKRYKKCGRRADVGHRPLRIHTRSAGKKSPSHGFAVPAPL